MKTYEQYREYRKPSWAPPAWLFGPVWTVLYILIAISFCYVGYLWIIGRVPMQVALPFILNLVFNFLFTTIQFKWRNFKAAFIDIIFVLGTLMWAMISIWPIEQWVVYINIPYVIWVSFATVLQFSVTRMNSQV